MKRASFVLPFAALLATGCAHIIPSSPSPVPDVPFFMNSAGPVTFHIVNGADDMLHEFIIVKTDLESTNLPLDPVTSRVNEDAIEIVASQDNIEPAHSRDLNVVLGEGHYVLICNLPGHYLQGMMVDFNVKGSSPVPTSESESTPSAPPAEQTPSGD